MTIRSILAAALLGVGLTYPAGSPAAQGTVPIPVRSAVPHSLRVQSQTDATSGATLTRVDVPLQRGAGRLLTRLAGARPDLAFEYTSANGRLPESVNLVVLFVEHLQTASSVVPEGAQVRIVADDSIRLAYTVRRMGSSEQRGTTTTRLEGRMSVGEFLALANARSATAWIGDKQHGLAPTDLAGIRDAASRMGHPGTRVALRGGSATSSSPTRAGAHSDTSSAPASVGRAPRAAQSAPVRCSTGALPPTGGLRRALTTEYGAARILTSSATPPAADAAQYASVTRGPGVAAGAPGGYIAEHGGPRPLAEVGACVTLLAGPHAIAARVIERARVELDGNQDERIPGWAYLLDVRSLPSPDTERGESWGEESWTLVPIAGVSVAPVQKVPAVVLARVFAAEDSLRREAVARLRGAQAPAWWRDLSAESRQEVLEQLGPYDRSQVEEGSTHPIRIQPIRTAVGVHFLVEHWLQDTPPVCGDLGTTHSAVYDMQGRVVRRYPYAIGILSGAEGIRPVIADVNGDGLDDIVSSVGTLVAGPQGWALPPRNSLAYEVPCT